MSEQEKTFQEVVKPAMEWLSKNKNPHAMIIIEATSAELVEGVESFVTDEFIPDGVGENPPTCPNCGGQDWHHSVECYLGQDLRPKENP